MDNDLVIVSKSALSKMLDEKMKRMSETLLTAINKKDTEENDVINIKEAAKLTGLSVNTLYQYSSRNEIPKLEGKTGKLLFSRKELIAWSNAGRPKILNEAINELIKKQSPNQFGDR